LKTIRNVLIILIVGPILGSLCIGLALFLLVLYDRGYEAPLVILLIGFVVLYMLARLRRLTRHPGEAGVHALLDIVSRLLR